MFSSTSQRWVVEMVSITCLSLSNAKQNYVYVKRHQRHAANFLKNMQSSCLCKITYVLTDNNAQFTYYLLSEPFRSKDKKHVFDVDCEALTIEHHTTCFFKHS